MYAKNKASKIIYVMSNKTAQIEKKNIIHVQTHHF